MLKFTLIAQACGCLPLLVAACASNQVGTSAVAARPARVASSANADGGWVLVADIPLDERQGAPIPKLGALWGIDAAGQEARKLVEGQTIHNGMSPALTVSPVGGLVAYQTVEDPDLGTDPHLVIASVPEGRLVLDLALAPHSHPAADETDSDWYYSDAGQPLRAITEMPFVAWSPDGSRLALVAALDSNHSDIYSYEVAAGTLRRLTEEGGQASMPTWSPDGSQVAYLTVKGFGTGAGLSLDGLWVVRANGSAARRVVDLAEDNDLRVIGWTDDGALVTLGWSHLCGSALLRRTRPSTAEVQTLVDGCLSDAALDPASGTLLLSQVASTSERGGGPAHLDPGVYVLGPTASAPRAVVGEDGLPLVPKRGVGITWAPAWEAFLVTGMGASRLVSPDGTTRPLGEGPAGAVIAPAPDAARVAWYGSGRAEDPVGLWLGEPDGGQPRKVAGTAVMDLVWRPDGAALFALGPDGTLSVAHAPDFTPREVTRITQPAGAMTWIR